MDNLMEFSVVAWILELDPRNDLRDRMVVQAVSDEIHGYLNRNLLSGEATELATVFDGLVYLREYPVREVFSVTDEHSGKILSVYDDLHETDLNRIEAHLIRALRVNGPRSSTVRVRYRYGYSRDELPAPIQNVLISVVRRRLMNGENPAETHGLDQFTDEFERLYPYKRIKVP